MMWTEVDPEFMVANIRIAANAEPLLSKWAPVVLRFFQLFVGDQALAESLAIDTLAEHLRERAPVPENDERVALLRRALKNGLTAASASTKLTDPILQAVTSLPARPRAVVILFRGLSLDLSTVAKVVGMDRVDVKRICLDALCDLHLQLSSGAINADEPDDSAR
jgi:hypothetical protein